MEFAAPLYGLLVIPVLLVLLSRLRTERKRTEDLCRFAEPHLLPGLLGRQGRPGPLARLLLPALTMLLLVAALMRPQWGIVEEEHGRTGIDLLFVIDLSRSMLADDLPPSRLAVAKRAVARAVASAPADRIGIVGFAGSAFTVCPFTTDQQMALRMLDELGTDTLPKGGSSLVAALGEAGKAFRGTPPGGRLLVLVSDGEDHAGGIDPALAELRRQGVVTLAALVGTPAGGLMPLPDGTFVKGKDGAVVKSRADLASLKLIDPSAAPVNADGSGLSERMMELRTTLRHTEQKQRRQRLAERYAVPLSAALLFSCLGLFLSGRRSAP